MPIDEAQAPLAKGNAAPELALEFRPAVIEQVIRDAARDASGQSLTSDINNLPGHGEFGGIRLASHFFDCPAATVPCGEVAASVDAGGIAA